MEDRQPSEADAEIEFILKSLKIDGSTVFTEEDLLSPYSDLNGRKINFEILNAIVSELTKKYRDSGYILSRVAFPAQEADSDAAVIRLVAIEGFISSVKYEGDEALVRSFQKKFAPVEKKLLAKKPLKHSDFEREMLIIQDLPGITVSSRFQESETPSGSVLVIELGKEVLEGSLGWSNAGTKSAGPGQVTASFSLNSLPIIGLQSTFSYFQTDPYKEYYSITISESYQFFNGIILSSSFSLSRSPEPDTEFARRFDYQTKGKTFNLNLSYPFIRSRDLNLSFGIGYEHRDRHADLNYEPYNTDRLRNLSFNVNFDFSDEWGGVTQAITTFTRGIKAFNASDCDPDASNTLAEADYFKADIYLSRTQSLPYGFGLLLSAEAMWSDKILDTYNQFSFGGSQFGRGYDSGILEGDKAFAVSLEPRWTYRFNGGERVIQPFIFIDYGKVWTNLNQVGVRDGEYGASYGAGVRFWGHVGSDYFPDFNLSAFGGKPLKRINDDNSSRFILRATFFI
jgi:hemolysin activation/secretion protein